TSGSTGAPVGRGQKVSRRPRRSRPSARSCAPGAGREKGSRPAKRPALPAGVLVLSRCPAPPLPNPALQRMLCRACLAPTSAAVPSFRAFPCGVALRGRLLLPRDDAQFVRVGTVEVCWCPRRISAADDLLLNSEGPPLMGMSSISNSFYPLLYNLA